MLNLLLRYNNQQHSNEKQIKTFKGLRLKKDKVQKTSMTVHIPELILC